MTSNYGADFDPLLVNLPVKSFHTRKQTYEQLWKLVLLKVKSIEVPPCVTKYFLTYIFCNIVRNKNHQNQEIKCKTLHYLRNYSFTSRKKETVAQNTNDFAPVITGAKRPTITLFSSVKRTLSSTLSHKPALQRGGFCKYSCSRLTLLIDFLVPRHKKNTPLSENECGQEMPFVQYK